MYRLDNSNGRFWRNLMSRLALIVVTVTVIVWSLPRYESQKFKYDIGKPWMYGSFIAKFDFPIYKTDEAIKAQEDSLLETYQPYYNYDQEVVKTQIDKLLPTSITEYQACRVSM